MGSRLIVLPPRMIVRAETDRGGWRESLQEAKQEERDLN